MKKILFASLLCASFSMPFMSSLKEVSGLTKEQSEAVLSLLTNIENTFCLSMTYTAEEEVRVTDFKKRFAAEDGKKVENMPLTAYKNAVSLFENPLHKSLQNSYQIWEEEIRTQSDPVATAFKNADKLTANDIPEKLERYLKTSPAEKDGSMKYTSSAIEVEHRTLAYQLKQVADLLVQDHQKVKNDFDAEKDNTLALHILGAVNSDYQDSKQFLQSMKEAVKGHNGKRSPQEEKYTILEKVLNNLKAWGPETQQDAKALKDLLANEVIVKDAQQRKEFEKMFEALEGLVIPTSKARHTKNTPVKGLKEKNLLEALIKKAYDEYLDSQTRRDLKASQESPTTKCTCLKRR